MKKVWLKRSLTCGVVASLFFGLASCGEDSGLGSSVDTEAPKLSIEYPPAAATIRGTFEFAGTCSDDKVVSAVKVKIKNLDTDVEYPELSAAVTNSLSWQVSVNAYDENSGYQLPDGKYQLDATAYDGSGRSSGVSSRQFDIDNTAPVFVISKPGVVKSAFEQNGSLSKYGTLFTIAGTISDDHSISKMDVLIYDENGNPVASEPYSEQEIATVGGTSVTIARYVENGALEPNKRYDEIYEKGTADANGNKVYSCAITITDSAKTYTVPSDSGVEGGNATSVVYLYDEVYKTYMSTKEGAGLTANDFRAILNGTATDKSISGKGKEGVSFTVEEMQSALASMAKNTALSAENTLAFSLNPNADPTYTVGGFKLNYDEAGETVLRTTNSALGGQTVTIAVSAGLDLTAIMPSSLKVWVKKFGAEEEETLSKEALSQSVDSLAATVQSLERAGADSDSFAEVEGWTNILNNAGDTSTSDTSITLTTTIPGDNFVEYNSYYAIAVTGHDQDDLYLSQNTLYGFVGTVSGISPTLTIVSPKNLAYVANSGAEKLSFSGTAVENNAGTHLRSVSATLTVTDENTGELVASPLSAQISGDENNSWASADGLSCTYNEASGKYEWTFVPSECGGYDSVAAESEGLSYMCTLEVTATSGIAGYHATDSRSVHIDTVKPVVTISSVTPSVSGEEYFGEPAASAHTYVNGIVTIKGSIEEQNLDDVTYDVWASTDLTKTLSAADDSILAELREYAADSGVDFDGSLGKKYSLNQPFNTEIITHFFIDKRGASGDVPIQAEVVLTATDIVGNKSTYSSKENNDGKNFVIYQETNRPKITLSNADLSYTDESGAEQSLLAQGGSANNVNAKHNLFGTTSNNKLSVSFTDDDSIVEYKIFLYNADGSALAAVNEYYKGANPYSDTPKKTSASESYLLPLTEGVYQVKIEVRDFIADELRTDETNKTGVRIAGPFFIAVDSGAPEIEITSPTALSYQSTAVSVKGTVSKTEGVSITGDLFDSNGAAVKGADGKPITFEASIEDDKTWSASFTMPSDASGTYAFMCTTTDKYGQKSVKSRSFNIDLTAPTFALSTVAGNPIPSDSHVYTSDKNSTVKGTISDGAGTSGIEGLYYLVQKSTEAAPALTGGTYTPSENGSGDSPAWTKVNAVATSTAGEYTWTANVDLAGSEADGTTGYTVYIAAVDDAGNISVAAENPSNSLVIYPDRTAPVTALTGTGLKMPAANAIASALADGAALSSGSSYYATDSSYKIAGSVTEASGNYTVTVNDTALSVTNGAWQLEVAGSGENALPEGAVTYRIVTTDGAGNADTKTVTVVHDTVPPVLTVTNETSDSAQLITNKKIFNTNANFSWRDSENKTEAQYLVSGTWSDATTGTGKLYYNYTILDGTEYKQSADIEVTGLSQSTTETSFNFYVPLIECDSFLITVYAKDAAGNETNHLQYGGLYVDTAVPEISLSETVADYYTSAPSFTVTAEDSFALSDSPISFTVKKNGTLATDSAAGFSIALTRTEAKKAVRTITLSADARWEVSATASDKAARSSANTVSFVTTLDTTAPSVTNYDYNTPAGSPTNNTPIVIGNAGTKTQSDWFSGSAQKLQGRFKEETSGLDAVYYFVDFPSRNDSEKMAAFDSASSLSALSAVADGSVSVSGTTGAGILYSLTPSNFAENAGTSANTVHIRAVDRAGNISTVSQYTVNIDNTNPAITPRFYTYDDSTFTEVGGTVMSNGTSGITLYGTVSDTASGVESISFLVGTASVTPNVLFSTGEVSESATAEELKDLAWNEYSSISEKAGITAWKTTISNTDLNTGIVKAVAKDRAGNVTTQQIFTVTLDNTSPELALSASCATTLVAGKTVSGGSTVTKTADSTSTRSINGKTTFSGTAKDNYTLSSVSAYYSSSAVAEIQSGDTLIGTSSGSDAYSWSFEKEVTALENGVMKILGTEYSGTAQDVYIKLVAQDSANNQSIYVYKYSADPASDTPTINVSNLAKSGGIVKYDTKISGSITDDDGFSGTSACVFKIYEITGTQTAAPTTTEDWASFMPASGTLEFNSSTGEWTYNLINSNDGTKTLYFYFKDSEGGEFWTAYNLITGASNNTAQNRIFCPKFLFTGKSDTSYAESGAALSFSVDQTSPTVLSAVSRTTSAGETTDTAISTSLVMGGDDSRLSLVISAKDANGIAGMTLSIANGSQTLYRATAAQIGDTTLDTSKYPSTTIDSAGFAQSTGGDPATATWTLSAIDISGFETGSATLSVVPYDNSGLVGSSTYTFMIDQTAPDIKITSPSSGAEVTGDITISGSAIDAGGSQTADIFWLVPTQAERTALTGKNEAEKRAYLKGLEWNGGSASLVSDSKVSVSQWQFKFDGNKNHKLDVYDNDTYATTINNGIYTIPIYFMAKDNLGNYAIRNDYTLNHNPDGDKPKVDFSYPIESDYDKGSSGESLGYATLGGTIRVTGSTVIPSNSTTVHSNYIQIADGEGKFNASDKEIVTSKYGLTVLSAYEVINKIKGESYSSANPPTQPSQFGFASKADMDAWWGILATGTASWNIVLNSDGKMDPEENSGDTNKITLRAGGVNANGKFGAWTTEANIISIHVDNSAPTIAPVVNQYDSTITGATVLNSLSASASQVYTSEMYLRGQWYLALEVLDESGIASITVKQDSATLAENVYFKSALEKTVSGKIRNGYTVLIPISAEKEGAVSYTVIAIDTDSTAHTATQKFNFNIDNTPPSLDSVADGSDTLLSESSENTVQNRDYVYTVKGSSVDDGAGVERIVFYYMRKAGTTKTSIENEVILDPLIRPGADSSSDKTDYSSVKVALPSSFENVSDGGIDQIAITQGNETFYLYARKKAGSMTTTTFTANSAYDAHVRVGSLVQIAGVLRKITAISGNTVTFTPEATAESESVTALFPIAQVIDATNTAKQNSANPFTFDSGKDDGDGMPESFTKSGTRWSWDASIHSDNMPDGPATLVVLAFDNAGNVSGKQYTVMVANNAPRIAKVHLGTDLNKNDAFTDNEFETYNIGAETGTDGMNLYSLTTAGFSKYKWRDATKDWEKVTSERKSFTVKNKLAVVPEFVGGNGDIQVVFINDDTTEGDDGKQTGTALKKAGTLVAGTGLSVTGDYWLFTELGEDTAEGASKKMSFTFWDSTDECTPGTDSQYAFLRVSDFVIDQNDGVAPNVVVEPFYWKSASDNSLYKNSTSEGHIELEDDLTEAITAQYGLAPKVSGKIVLRGTAYDDTFLGKLSFSMTNFDEGSEILMAEYNSQASKWDVSNADMAGNHYEVSVDEVYFNQDGHKVKWSVAIDTAHLSDVAHRGAEFTVIAQDNAASKNVSGATGKNGTDDATKHVPAYTMDVVPYITGLYTSLSESAGKEFARSATGRYIVRGSAADGTSETVKLYGFNLAAGTDAVKVGTVSLTPTAGGTDKNGSYLSLVIGTGTVSGDLSITVNGMESLNNKNKNPTFASDSDDTITAVEYNSQANGTTNNRLTDDVSLWVWDLRPFDTQMNTTNITSPMMKFDAGGNYYISYGRGSNYFAIERNGIKTDLESCYNKYHNTNVAFDSAGNFYGVATNTDRISSGINSATSFTFFSRELGNRIADNNTNIYIASNGTAVGNYYDGTNKRRLELSQYGGDTGTYNINRVQRPKLTVSGNGNAANVYLAYYDSSADNVKFRYGTVSGRETLSGGGWSGYTRNGAMSGGISNDLTGNTATTSSATGYHLIADSNTTYKGGAYTAVGYTSGGVAVVAWYDASKRQLVYSYNTAPGTVDSTGATWQTNATVIDASYAGWYVDLTVDAGNGIHIAYYKSSTGDLKYAYIPFYDKAADAQIVTVDSYLSVGTNITINTRLEGGKYVPYIYYYNTSSNQTMNSIKVAWREDMTNLRDGAADDKFTGAWESMTIPTTNIPVDATVCGGVPAGGTYSNTVVLGYMTDTCYEKAYIKK